MSFWSFSWNTLKNRGGGGAGPPGPGAGNPVAATCIVATIWANKVALVGGGLEGLLVLLVLAGVVVVVVAVVELLHLLHLLLCLQVVGLVQPFQNPNVTVN